MAAAARVMAGMSGRAVDGLEGGDAAGHLKLRGGKRDWKVAESSEVAPSAQAVCQSSNAAVFNIVPQPPPSAGAANSVRGQCVCEIRSSRPETGRSRPSGNGACRLTAVGAIVTLPTRCCPSKSRPECRGADMQGGLTGLMIVLGGANFAVLEAPEWRRTVRQQLWSILARKIDDASRASRPRQARS